MSYSTYNNQNLLEKKPQEVCRSIQAGDEVLIGLLYAFPSASTRGQRVVDLGISKSTLQTQLNLLEEAGGVIFNEVIAGANIWL